MIAGKVIPCNPSIMTSPRSFVLLLALCSGCADPRISVAVPEAEIGTPLYTAQALAGAEHQFLDIDLPKGAPSGQGAPDSGTAHWTARQRIGPRLHLRAEWQQPLTGNVTLVTRGDYRLAETLVRFPQGIDVFTDPADARLMGHEVAAEVGLSADLPIGGTRPVRAFAGAGFSAAWVRTHVSSALLNVHSQTRTVQPYLALGLSRDLNDRLSLHSDLRLDGKSFPDLSVGLAVRF